RGRQRAGAACHVVRHARNGRRALRGIVSKIHLAPSSARFRSNLARPWPQRAAGASRGQGDIVKYRTTMAAALLGVMLGATAPSYAQGPRLPNGFIAPEGIIAIVRANGMNPIGPPVMAGPPFLWPAFGP